MASVCLLEDLRLCRCIFGWILNGIDFVSGNKEMIGGDRRRCEIGACLRVFWCDKSASLIQRRGLAGAADHHGPAKVDFWKDPMSPSKWKEEHFVIVSLAGWGLAIFGGYKAFSGGKKEEPMPDSVEEFVSAFISASSSSALSASLFAQLADR
ncbi:hypothetical protein CTI12_AA357150 [Artemisia annua]|uniref:Uncharacterized protein n=1 Tax=Artemisia annua TaxID=35608 RepID=A0A2U1MPE4_ARTAN|nr:hypothetical protein CTI12_AA357150 [Artemisia annua]